MSGANADSFEITTATPFAESPCESVDVAFTISPNGVTGEVAASFVFESNDAESPFTTAVSGLIHDPQITLNAEALDFGVVTELASLTLMVGNAGGTQPLVLASATVSGVGASAFTVSEPTTIAPDRSEILTVTFDPGGAVGAFDTMLVLASNDPLQGEVSVPLSARVPISDAVFVSFDAFIDGDQAQYP